MNHQVKAAGKEAQSVFVVGPLKEDNHIIKNKEKKKKKSNAVGDGPSPNNVQTHPDAQNSPMLNM